MAKKLSFRFVLASLLTACASGCVFGQTTGRITGVVKDSSGGVIVWGEVQAVNEGEACLLIRNHSPFLPGAFVDGLDVYPHNHAACSGRHYPCHTAACLRN